MARIAAILFAGLIAALVMGGVDAQDKKPAKIDFDTFFKKLDGNGDGKLQKDEFLKLADRNKDKEKAREKLTAVFAKIDDKMAGYLLKDQFRTYLDNVKKKDDNR